MNSSLEETIIKMYVEEEKSAVVIADEISAKFPEINIYPMKINRMLKKAGVKVRNKTEALKAAFRAGRKESPTKGKTRTEEERDAISKGFEKYWDKLTKKEKHKRSRNSAKASKDRWKNITEEERLVTVKKMNLARSKSFAKTGSKFENALLEALKAAGYACISHYKLERGETTEIDILIDNVYAIEVDGPTHFRDVYGEDIFNASKERDQKKDSIILGAGMRLMRMRNDKTKISKVMLRRAVKTIKDWIESGAKGTPYIVYV